MNKQTITDQELYYIAPSDDVFNEVKLACMLIWNGYDNEIGYVDEKVNAIKDLGNIKDNFMYMVAMFDVFNQSKLFKLLSTEASEAIKERLPEDYIEDYILNSLSD